MMQKAGYAAIIGCPNAGKSTLVNVLVGTKVSIVSPKVQTTRARCLGIMMLPAHEPDTQVLLIDTPGIFDPKKRIERAMVDNAVSALGDADVTVHLVDASMPDPLESNRGIIELLGNHKKSVYLVLNKIDKIDKDKLLELTTKFQGAYTYGQVFMISALRQNGLDALKNALHDAMPEGPFLFPEDDISDMPMRMLAAEITREKVFHRLHQELPYAIFVETEEWENFDNGDVRLRQIIYVQRDSQKGIVLGKGGQQLKAIGQSARLELEEILDQRVHLKIFVKVKEKWDERAEFYRLMGLDA